MKIINNKKIVINTSDELKEILENDNSYEYIYLENDITLTSGINNNKEKVIIDGTYNNIRSKLTGIISTSLDDTIVMNSKNSIEIRNIDIEYTNTYGVVYSNVNAIIIFKNVNFNGTQLSYNPYGSTKIEDSIINIKTMNEVAGEEVCESDRVIIGGKTNISSNATKPLFTFKNNTTSPSVIFLCRSDIIISNETGAFMNGTNKLNFTILHDTSVSMVTGNGFAEYTVCGANNVLIEERAKLSFIENKHQRIPMWSIFGNLTVKEGASLEVINSYESTPSDNYNIHFKGSSCNFILDNPASVVFYTKNANVIYTNEPLNFSFKCSRLNFWSSASSFATAGGIDNLPDYFWYKENDLMVLEGILTSSLTSITKMNLTNAELSKLSDIGNFSFLSRKQFSIGTNIFNVHPINNTTKKISGHAISFCDVLIKYSSISTIVQADENGLFEYSFSSDIPDNTEVEITANLPGSFLYGTRRISTPYNGELSFIGLTSFFVFSLNPISINPTILPKSKDLIIKVVDSRLTSTDWKLYASINKPATSQMGYVLNDALIFKKLDDEIVVLNENLQLVFNGTSRVGDIELLDITFSREKGPLLDLSNNALEINEEYFSSINFKLEE